MEHEPQPSRIRYTAIEEARRKLERAKLQVASLERTIEAFEQEALASEHALDVD
jgi:hypothetical protein